MAIVKMKKLTLAAPQDERDEVLNLLQTIGYVQLVNFRDKLKELEGFDVYKEANSVSDTEVEYNKIRFSYDFLRHYSDKKDGMFTKRASVSKEEFEDLENKVDWLSIYTQCKEVEEGLNRNKTQKGKMSALIDQYTSWERLDVCLDELTVLNKTSYLIGSISKKYESQVIDELVSEFKDVYIEKVSEKQQDLNLFILFHASETHEISDVLKKYGFTKLSLDLSKTPKEQIGLLKNQIQDIDIENNILVEEAKKLSLNIRDIEKIYDYIENKLQKERAISNLIKTQKTFILQGWLPEDKAAELEELIEKNHKDALIGFEDPVEDENPPILLKNNAFNEPFEVITSMYALPRSVEVDPTPVLTPFFMIFFGMMMADIGYGTIMLIFTTAALKFMDVEGNTRKMIKLIQYCSIPTIIFGVLYGSFLGGIIKLTPLWIDPVNEPMTVLTASIILGMIHLYVGLGVKAYTLIRDGKVLDAIYDVGFWYAIVSGLIWMLLGGGTPAKIIAIVGAVGLIATQGRANESLVGKFFGGIYGLYGITGYLGDALSYSRLLALGLASGLIGWSFNLLVGLLGDGIIGIVFGPIVFLAGHTFNFLIGALGTFVHTCRLQYLEFFGKFYEGGGRAFEPLKINTKFIKVKTER